MRAYVFDVQIHVRFRSDYRLQWSTLASNLTIHIYRRKLSGVLIFHGLYTGAHTVVERSFYVQRFQQFKCCSPVEWGAAEALQVVALRMLFD